MTTTNGANGSNGTPRTPNLKDAMARPLPKRFYKDVAIGSHDGVHQILLDGRRANTPGKRPLALATLPIAERIADEWRAQKDVIAPSTMPLTTLACTALDAVAGREREVAAEIIKYAGSDLLCYRADRPEKLIARQAKHWDPVLAWAADALGARFAVTQGLVFVAQPPEAQAAVAKALEGRDALTLAALHVLTTITGSAVLALALLYGHIAFDAAWNAAHVDEDFQIEEWGADHEAEARRAIRRKDAEAAAAVLHEHARHSAGK